MKSAILMILILTIVVGCQRPPQTVAPSTPMPTPDPFILHNPFDEPPPQPRPWLTAGRTDGVSTNEGLPPDKAIFLSDFEPIVTKENEQWKITFR